MRRSQDRMIDAIDNGRVHILPTRGRDNDLLGAAFEMAARLLFSGKEAGAFMDYIDTQLTPIMCSPSTETAPGNRP